MNVLKLDVLDRHRWLVDKVQPTDAELAFEPGQINETCERAEKK